MVFPLDSLSALARLKIVFAEGESVVVVRHLVISTIVHFVEGRRSGGYYVLVLVFVVVLRFELADSSSIKVCHVLNEVTELIVGVKEVTVWNVIVVPGSVVLGSCYPEFQVLIALVI